MLNYCANGPSGYTINNSLRFRSSASAYLSRTFATTGTNNKIQTFSAWVKRGKLGVEQRIFDCYNGSSPWSSAFYFTSGDTLEFDFGGASQNNLVTTQVFRDPSAWYHIVVKIDTTQSTASNRIIFYINGLQVTSYSTSNYPSQNATSQWAINTASNILMAQWNGASGYTDGYLTEVNFIDGQALTPSSFGQTSATTGVWQPKQYTGTYGTNGFYLPFSSIALTSGSNTGLGKDFSGNGNYWNTNNISVTSGTTYDAMIDSPTNASASGTQPVGNYATWNPLEAGGNGTYASANLLATCANLSATTNPVQSTVAFPTTGKWYCEVTGVSVGANTVGIGIILNTSKARDTGSYFYAPAGTKYINGSNSTYGSSWTNNDVIGIAFDAGAGTLTMYKNNVSQGTLASSITGTYNLALAGGGAQTIQCYVNFGQRPFSYTPPSGHQALCTTNLPDSTIVQGNRYMDATLYTGNNTINNIVNAAGFQPDLVWIKSRSNGSTNNYLTNSNAGRAYGQGSNIADAQYTSGSGNDLTAFNSNGFSLGSISQWDCNNNAYTFVAWQWQAGKGTNTSNTSGSITSTVSVNTTAGFSIVTYTGNNTSGATFGHGLGVAPKMVIVKDRSGAGQNWAVYHASIGNTGGLALNLTNSTITASGWWNNTSPTSTLITLGGSTGSDWYTTNKGSDTYVAYCFAEIAGFSKFGSYTGNGSTDGPFVYLGFRPKFVMTKKTDTTSNWSIHDSSRATYNLTINELYPDTSDAEYTGTNDSFDFLSNGFKARAAGTPTNTSGGTYIYAAFAENPFKNALAR